MKSRRICLKIISEQDVKITLYENGYILVNVTSSKRTTTSSHFLAALRPYDDEEGKEFMKELNKGYIPEPSLEPQERLRELLLEPLRKKYPRSTPARRWALHLRTILLRSRQERQQVHSAATSQICGLFRRICRRRWCQPRI